MTSQPGRQLQYTYSPIFYGIQAVKFGQIIEYKKKNIFIQKSCGKRGREASSKPLFIF